VRSYTLFSRSRKDIVATYLNPLNAELNPICHLLALLRAHHILHVSRIRVNNEVWNYTVAVSVDCFLPPLSCVFCYILYFSFPHNQLRPVVLAVHLEVHFHTFSGYGGFKHSKILVLQVTIVRISLSFQPMCCSCFYGG
jgi:hypothetical protein